MKTLRVIAPVAGGWRGRVGNLFRAAISSVTSYWLKNVRIGEKIAEAPDLAWKRVQGEADEKHSKSLVNYAEEKQKNLSNDLSEITFLDAVRVAKANADKAEFEAQSMGLQVMNARLDLIERFRKLGFIPVWDGSGKMFFTRVAEDFRWDDLKEQLLSGKLPGQPTGDEDSAPKRLELP